MELAQVAQHAEDLTRARAFYESLLGEPARAVFDPPGLLFFDLAGVRLLLDRAAPSSLIYLRVDSVRESIERLRATGVVVDTEPHIIFTHSDDTLGPAGADEWQAFVADSEGNQIGLISHE